MLNVHLLTPPTVEPVSVEQLRAHLRMDPTFTIDDALLGSYLIAARLYAEQYTRRAFLPQQWCLTRDQFPIPKWSTTLTPQQNRDALFVASYDYLAITLPKPTCVSVDSIVYTDFTSAQCTLPSSSYTVDTSSKPARVVPSPGSYWPIANCSTPGAVKITFTAATYSSVQDVPQTLVMAIMLLAAHWYAHSEASSATNLSDIPFGVNALLDMHKFTCLTYEDR